MADGILSMDEGFDVEAKGWADTHDVLAIELLDDGGFPCIIESAEGI